jgi:hypothetical protein
MITMEELNPHNFATTPEILSNLNKLLEAINKIRSAYGKPMLVTSGLRSIEDHKRIYREKGVEESAIPMKSKHLYGLAVDIVDNDGKLYEWCRLNEYLIEQAGIWLEIRMGNWQHFQIESFKSYKKGSSIWFTP